MSNLHKTAFLAVVAGMLVCAGSAEPGLGVLRAEAQPEARVAEARPVQLHCRIYFGCAPLARAGQDAARSE